MSHEWPVNNTIVDLPIRLKRNSKCICGNKFVESAGDSEQGYAKCYVTAKCRGYITCTGYIRKRQSDNRSIKINIIVTS